FFQFFHRTIRFLTVRKVRFLPALFFLTVIHSLLFFHVNSLDLLIIQPVAFHIGLEKYHGLFWLMSINEKDVQFPVLLLYLLQSLVEVNHSNGVVPQLQKLKNTPSNL